MLLYVYDWLWGLRRLFWFYQNMYDAAQDLSCAALTKPHSCSELADSSGDGYCFPSVCVRPQRFLLLYPIDICLSRQHFELSCAAFSGNFLHDIFQFFYSSGRARYSWLQSSTFTRSLCKKRLKSTAPEKLWKQQA